MNRMTKNLFANINFDRWRTAGLICLPLLAVVTAIVVAKFGVLFVVGGVGALLTGLAMLYRPDLATYLFVGLIYSNAPAAAVKFHGVPKIAAGAVFGLLLIPFAAKVFFGKQPLVINRIVPWIFGFILVQLVSSVIAQRMHVSTPVIVSSVIEGFLLFGLVINVVRTPEVLRKVVWTLVIVGGILGSLSLFQKVTNTYDKNYGGFAQISMVERNGEMVVSENPRSVGAIGEKNYYAQFMLFLVPLGILVTSAGDKTPLRILAILCVAAILAAIGLTASRGAAVGFLALLFGLTYLQVFKLKQVLVILVLAIAFVANSEGFRERVVDLWDASSVVQGGDVRNVDKSVQGRASEMLAAVIIFQKHPVLGVGAGNFPFHFSRNADALGFSVHGEERLAHCSYLEIAAELGFIGLIIFVALFYFTIVDLIRARKITNCEPSKKLATAFLLTVILMVVTSVFLSFAYVRYYWLILALASCAARIASTQPSASPQKMKLEQQV